MMMTSFIRWYPCMYGLSCRPFFRGINCPRHVLWPLWRHQRWSVNHFDVIIQWRHHGDPLTILTSSRWSVNYVEVIIRWRHQRWSVNHVDVIIRWSVNHVDVIIRWRHHGDPLTMLTSSPDHIAFGASSAHETHTVDEEIRWGIIRMWCSTVWSVQTSKHFTVFGFSIEIFFSALFV